MAITNESLLTLAYATAPAVGHRASNMLEEAVIRAMNSLAIAENANVPPEGMKGAAGIVGASNMGPSKIAIGDSDAMDVDKGRGLDKIQADTTKEMGVGEQNKVNGDEGIGQ